MCVLIACGSIRRVLVYAEVLVRPSVCVHSVRSCPHALLVFVASCGDQVRCHGCSKPIAPGDDTLERGNLQQPGVGQRVNKRLSWGPSK